LIYKVSKSKIASEVQVPALVHWGGQGRQMWRATRSNDSWAQRPAKSKQIEFNYQFMSSFFP